MTNNQCSSTTHILSPPPHHLGLLRHKHQCSSPPGTTCQHNSHMMHVTCWMQARLCPSRSPLSVLPQPLRALPAALAATTRPRVRYLTHGATQTVASRQGTGLPGHECSYLLRCSQPARDATTPHGTHLTARAATLAHSHCTQVPAMPMPASCDACTLHALCLHLNLTSSQASTAQP